MKNNKIIKRLLSSMLVVAMVSLLLVTSAFAWSSDRWKSNIDSGHRSLIESLSSGYFNIGSNLAANQALTAEAAWLTDSDAFNLAATKNTPNPSPYHAKSDYSMNQVIAHAGFLYNLAKECLSGSSFDTAIAKCINIDTYSAGVYTGTIDSATELRIISDLTSLMNYKSATSAYDRGYVILGVYLHLLQDIYAHRAKFTQEMVGALPNFQNNFAYTIDGLKGQIGSSGKPMIRLKDYLNPSLKDNYIFGNYSNLSDGGVYEDNPYYWSARYSAAKTATKAQLTNIMNKYSFTFSNYNISLYDPAL